MRKLLVISSCFFALFLAVIIPAKADSTTGSTFTITKAAAPATVAPSGTITYSITLKNISTSNAAPQAVADTLPTGFTFAGNPKLTTISGTQVTFTPTQTGQTLTWTFDGDSLQSIPQNQQIVISYQVTASSTTGTYRNTACLTAPENICANQDVIVATAPSAGIVSDVLLGLLFGTLLVFLGIKLTRTSKSFEQKILAR